MLLVPLLVVLAVAQGTNACDGGTPRVYPLCIGERLVLWTCAAPTLGALGYTVSLDGIAQPGGTLVRYGFNTWGQHLEAPFDVSATGRVQYVTSHPVTLTTPGAHTVTVTYGAGQTVAIPLLGVTSVTSLTQFGPDGQPLISECPSAARRGR